MYPVKNKTVFTKEIWDEAYKKIWDAPYKKAIQKFLYIIAVLFIVSFVMVFGTGLPTFYLLTESFMIVVILFYIIVMIPRNNKKKMYKKMAMGANEAWRNYTFYQDHVTVYFPNESTDDVSYHDFTDIYYGNHIILIYTTGKRNILLDKNGFQGEIPAILKKEEN